MLIGSRCGAHTFYIEVKNPSAKVEHEATTSKIGEDQIFYCNAAVLRRGCGEHDRERLCKEVFSELPMEFAMEAQALMDVSLKAAWDNLAFRIKNLQAGVEGKEIPKGIDLSINVGKSTRSWV